MPRQTINQWSRRRRRREREFPVLCSKDDSFINEHLIPEKANDHSSAKPDSKFPEANRQKLDYQIESGSWFLKSFYFDVSFVKAKRRRSGLKDQRARKNNGLGRDQL